MSATIPEKKNPADCGDYAEIIGNPPPQHSGDSLQSVPNECKTAPAHPATELYQPTVAPDPRGKPDNSGALDIAETVVVSDTSKEIPVDSLNVELELPSKKLSTTLTGVHYLDYKNMLDTLLFPKGTTSGTKDEIILNAAIEHIVALAKKASQNSVSEKGTPFISAGALLAKLWES